MNKRKIRYFEVCRSASEDLDLLNLGNPTDALPAIFSHLSKVFHAVEVNGDIFAFLLSSFLTGSESFVDVINALNLLIVGAGVVCGDALLGEGR